MHPSGGEPPRSRGAIEALVDAERVWRIHLEEARAAAAGLLEAARADAARQIAVSSAELDALVEQRRRDIATEVASEVARIRQELARRAARYSEASDDEVRRVAEVIIRRAPWFARGEAPEQPA